MNPKDILGFPKMVFLLVWSLIYYTLTEVETFLLAVVAAFYGYHYGIVWGFTVFFSIYLVIRMIGGYVGLMANKLDWIGQAISRTKGGS